MFCLNENKKIILNYVYCLLSIYFFFILISIAT